MRLPRGTSGAEASWSGPLKRAISGLVIGLVVAIAALTIVTRDAWTSDDGLIVLVSVALAGVGLVIIREQARNTVGWLFIATGLLALSDTLNRVYLVLDYRQHNGTLPLGRLAYDWRGGIGLLAFLVGLPAILFFPNGEIPSRNWRRAVWVYAILAAVFSVLQLGGTALHAMPRPLHVDIRGSVNTTDPGIAAGTAWLATPVFVAFWFGSIGHQVRKWRRATGEQRAQLKWLMSGAAVAVVSSILIPTVGDGTSPTSRTVADVAIVGIGLMPVAVGIGILKYRLYEIDKLISRTLSYTIVTGLLAGTFVGLVVLITDVLPFSSPVAVAASTLTAAALFNPLRGRVQRIVDHRFNRARFDSEQTVDAFARHLRDAVDIETVRAGLLQTVDVAVQPAHLSVWLRGSE